MNKNLLPYDIYERHRKVAEFIERGTTVLDVGGELNHLSQFSKPSKVVVANLNTGDVIIKKGRLPFKNDSYDIVCSIDVLEHIPKKNREAFVEDLVKIAKKKVILSFPTYTDKHEAYEIELQGFLKRKGEDVTYLNEHIKNGLPDPQTFKESLKDLRISIFYSGNLSVNNLLFKLLMFDPKIKFLRNLVYNLKNLFYLLSNPLFYLFLSQKKFTSSVNRAYMVIEK